AGAPHPRPRPLARPAARVGPARQREAGQRRRHAGLGLPGLGTAAARQSRRANRVVPRLARALRGTGRCAARNRRLTRRAEPKHAAGAPARPCRAHARAMAQGPRAAQVSGGSVAGARMRPTADLPDDPRLPGLMAIRDSGLARAIPALGLEQGEGGVELVLCGYHPGARATLDARVGQRRFAVKTFADDPEPEAALYQALGAAGLAGDSGARVPPLLAWEHDLRVLVIGWLEGPTAHDLVKQGQGRHAGELAAQWARRTASLPVKLGLPLGAAGMMHETRAWIGTLGTADLSVGAAARALAEALARTEPRDDGVVGLVHGTLYARHILDVGDGPGVIDWHRFGQGRRFWRGRATWWTSARWHGIERPRCCSSRSVCRPPDVAIGGSGRTH